MQLQQQGLSYEQYLEITNADPNEMLQQAKEPALRQVRMDLAMTAIIEAEKIEATEEEIEKEYADMAEKYGMDVENVKKYLTPDVVEDQIKSQKAIRIVTASATVSAPEEEKAEEAEKAE
jgi:trigger factor